MRMVRRRKIRVIETGLARGLAGAVESSATVCAAGLDCRVFHFAFSALPHDDGEDAGAVVVHGFGIHSFFTSAALIELMQSLPAGIGAFVDFVVGADAQRVAKGAFEGDICRGGISFGTDGRGRAF